VGFLDLIDTGDVILVDQGFNVHDNIAIRGGRLEIPAFTKVKNNYLWNNLDNYLMLRYT